LRDVAVARILASFGALFPSSSDELEVMGQELFLYAFFSLFLSCCNGFFWDVAKDDF
jgi:hypothetical protein